MDSKKAAELLNKYWENKTSLKEEKELKRHFLLQEKSDTPDVVYFDYINKKNDDNPLDERFDADILEKIGAETRIKKHKHNKTTYWLAAASLVLIISFSIIFKNEIIQVKQPVQIAEVDTYDDPEKAFEETKRALLLISSKINGPSEYTSEFSKFEKSQNTIKQN